MAPHAEPSPPPSPRTEHKPTPPPPSSRFTSHLLQIPIVSSTASLLAAHTPTLATAFTASKNLTASFIPASVLARADTLADTLLGSLEDAFPALKTPTRELTARPRAVYEKLVDRPLAFLSTAAGIYKAAAVERVAAARESLGGVYRTYVESVVARYTDASVKRINDRFEGAVEGSMPKSYREAIVEGGGEGREKEERVELYRSWRLARNAAARGRVRFWVPMKSVAARTCEDVKEGGGAIRGEVGMVPGRVRDGAVYVWRVGGEEVQRERAAEGGGVRGAGRVVYRVGERCAGEAVGIGLVAAAKAAGLVWGVWGLGREKAKKA